MSELFPVAILAGGLAKRMRPLTETVPKAMLDVAGAPFIAHQLRLLAGQGVRRVVLCVGYLGEAIQTYVEDGDRFGISVSYSFDGPFLRGTAGALKSALPLLGKNFFVLYGDSYLTCDFAAVQRSFESGEKLALMTVYRNDDMWDSSNVEFDGGRILAYDKTRRTPRMRYIDYGLGVFDEQAFRACPDESPSDLSHLYRALLDRGELGAFEVTERFYEIGSAEGLRALSGYLEKRQDGGSA